MSFKTLAARVAALKRSSRSTAKNTALASMPQEPPSLDLPAVPQSALNPGKLSDVICLPGPVAANASKTAFTEFANSDISKGMNSEIREDFDRLKVVVVWNPKGGCGKSTATVHLAMAALLAGDGPVLIHDVDPQGTTADWFNKRKQDKIPNGPGYAPLTVAGLKNQIAALSEAGAAYLFIDMMAGVGPNDDAILAVADRVLIPTNPKPADLKAMNKKLSVVRKAGKPFSFMLSRCRPNLRTNANTSLALDALGLVLPTLMHEREIYSDTFGHGLTAFELEPNGVAAREAAALWANLKTKLELDNSRKDEFAHEQTSAA